jgi:hypothetical protein
MSELHAEDYATGIRPSLIDGLLTTRSFAGTFKAIAAMLLDKEESRAHATEDYMLQ